MSQKSQTSPTEEKEESKEKHTDEATEKETKAKNTLEVPKPYDEEKGTDKDEVEEKKDDEEQKDDKDDKITGIVESVKGEEEPEELQVLEEVPVIIYRPDVEYKAPPKPQNLGIPFKVKWLNDCYQQTLLPDAPWHTIEDKIARELVLKMEKHFQKPKRREAILQTLGQLFVQKYLPDVTLLPQVLEPPEATVEERDRLLDEARDYLTTALYKTVREVGYQKMLTPNAKARIPEEYHQFIDHTTHIHRVALERELYNMEKNLPRKKHTSTKAKARAEELIAVPVPSDAKPTGQVSPVSSSSSLGSKILQNIEEEVVPASENIILNPPKPPPLWGPQSNVIGEAISAILKRDRGKFDIICSKLHGRQLPGNLRKFLWKDVLFSPDRKRLHKIEVESIVKETFTQILDRNVLELGLYKPTRSTIGGLILNGVVDCYAKCTSMKNFRTEANIKDTSGALNVLYVYERTYEPYLIYWIFPLQVAFQVTEGDTHDHTDLDRVDHAIDLAVYLDLFNSSFFPRWPEIFAIAELVMQILSEEDPDLFTHLKAIAINDVRVNKKEFMVQMISKERDKAEEFLKVEPGTDRDRYLSAELLADPLVFVRKWVGEGFVSVLDTPSVMFIWDQCFMQMWRPSVLRHFALAMLELLRGNFMLEEDYLGMRRVFLEDSRRIFTTDLQRAWLHLEKGNDLMEIPYLNRQFAYSPAASARSSRASWLASFAATPDETTYLKGFGVKGIVLRLNVPSETVSREPWLTTLVPGNVKVHIMVYYGSIQLKLITSKEEAEVTSIERTFAMSTYELWYRYERHIFEDIDLMAFDISGEVGASPYLIFEVEYNPPGATTRTKPPVPLGWARVPLYKKSRKRRNSDVDGTKPLEEGWALLAGDFKYMLVPGQITEKYTQIKPGTPASVKSYSLVEGDLLGYNSELHILLYNPEEEPEDRDNPQGRTPSPPPSIPTPSEGDIPPEILYAEAETVVSSEISDIKDLWVEHRPEVTGIKLHPQDYKETSVPMSEFISKPHIPPVEAQSDQKEIFDLYIDQIRWLPDIATVVKVTGAIGVAPDLKVFFAVPEWKGSARNPNFTLRLTCNEEKKKMDIKLVTGAIGVAPDLKVFFAVPEWKGSARNPNFTFRLTYNEEKKKMDIKLVAFLRVYTRDLLTDELIIIGSVFLPIFMGKEKGNKFNIGGHQLHLRNGTPKNRTKYRETDLDTFPVVPTTTLLVRLLPHEKKHREAPDYRTGYYISEACKPNFSEIRIFETWKKDISAGRFPNLEVEMINRQQQKNDEKAGVTEDEVITWLQERLDLTKHLSGKKGAENMDLARSITYRIETGVRVQVFHGWGLEDNSLYQYIGNVSPGNKTMTKEPTKEGWGRLEMYLSNSFDFESMQAAPKFGDPPKRLRAFYDEHTVLVLQIYGFECQYKPRADHKLPGTVHTLTGSRLVVGDEEVVGWTLVPLFKGNSVLQGVHELPIFNGLPFDGIVRGAISTDLETLYKTYKWPRNFRSVTASITVGVWDAHYDWEDVPEKKVYTDLLGAVGSVDKYMQARNPVKPGKKMADFILDNLEYKLKKQGSSAPMFAKEREFFMKLMNDIWKKTPKHPVTATLLAEDREKAGTPLYSVDFQPWIQHDPLSRAEDPPASGLKDALDLYIDQVRWIPDSCTLVKVTGIIGMFTNTKVFLALPLLDESARSPNFDFKIVFKQEKQRLEKSILAYIRVYTQDNVTKTVYVVGNVFIPLFDEDGKLRVGGHQMPLKTGIPERKPRYTANELSKYPRVPGCSILIRLLPHSADYIDPPDYSTGYYYSDSCKPNVSESNIFLSYDTNSPDFPLTVREAINLHKGLPLKRKKQIKKTDEELEQIEQEEREREEREAAEREAQGLPIEEEEEEEEVEFKIFDPYADEEDDTQELHDYIDNELDEHTLGSKIRCLPLIQCLKYRVNKGLKIKIHQGFALQEAWNQAEAIWMQCFVQFSNGEKTFGAVASPEGFGEVPNFYTIDHDWTSYMPYPIWKDDPEIIKPYYDPNSCLIIKILGFPVVYWATEGHTDPGKVTTKKGKQIALTEKEIIAWTVLPIFNGNAVLSGTHYLPLFKGNPSENLILELRKRPVKEVFDDMNWKNLPRYQFGQLKVDVWDSHYEFEEIPENPVYENLLKIFGKIDDFREAREIDIEREPKKISFIIIDALEPKFRSRGIHGSVFRLEQGFFLDIMKSIYLSLLDEAQEKTGLLSELWVPRPKKGK